MKNLILSATVLSLYLFLGCGSNSDRVRKLEKDVAEKERIIKTLQADHAEKDKMVEQLLARLNEGSNTSGGRKLAWETVYRNAKKMQKNDGKYACFYTVLENADAEGVKAVTETLVAKGYKVSPTPWDGVIEVGSPLKVVPVLVFLKKINTVRNIKALNDDNLREIRATEGVKSVWPQSAFFFPAKVWLIIPPDKRIEVDVKIIGLPPEFFEAEKDRLDIKEFSRYDGGGAQVIMPAAFMDYYTAFYRFSEGWKLDYEKSFKNEEIYFKVDLAASTVFDVETNPVSRDLKVVGITDRIDTLAVIVKPEVIDDWNKTMFDKKK